MRSADQRHHFGCISIFSYLSFVRKFQRLDYRVFCRKLNVRAFLKRISHLGCYSQCYFVALCILHPVFFQLQVPVCTFLSQKCLAVDCPAASCLLSSLHLCVIKFLFLPSFPFTLMLLRKVGQYKAINMDRGYTQNKRRWYKTRKGKFQWHMQTYLEVSPHFVVKAVLFHFYHFRSLDYTGRVDDDTDRSAARVAHVLKKCQYRRHLSNIHLEGLVTFAC